MYYVIGGEYTDTDFEEFKDGKGEEYGPFETYEKAEEIWRKHSWLNVDTCNCRFSIKERENG